MLDNLSLEDLLVEEWVVKDRRFFFTKLPFARSFQVFETIRHELRHASDALAPVLTADRDAKAGINLVAGIGVVNVVLGLDPIFVEKIKAELFKFVRYATQKNKVPETVAGDEDSAFEGLTVFDVYEVLVRALAINFIGPFREWLSRERGAALLATG